MNLEKKIREMLKSSPLVFDDLGFFVWKCYHIVPYRHHVSYNSWKIAICKQERKKEELEPRCRTINVLADDARQASMISILLFERQDKQEQEAKDEKKETPKKTRVKKEKTDTSA